MDLLVVELLPQWQLESPHEYEILPSLLVVVKVPSKWELNPRDKEL
jgi:hypothetical protein